MLLRGYISRESLRDIVGGCYEKSKYKKSKYPSDDCDTDREISDVSRPRPIKAPFPESLFHLSSHFSPSHTRTQRSQNDDANPVHLLVSPDSDEEEEEEGEKKKKKKKKNYSQSKAALVGWFENNVTRTINSLDGLEADAKRHKDQYTHSTPDTSYIGKHNDYDVSGYDKEVGAWIKYMYIFLR